MNDKYGEKKCGLVMDFGNTLTKVAVFSGYDLLEQFSTEVLGADQLSALRGKYVITHAIYAAVIDINSDIKHYLEKHFETIRLDHNTPIPVKNCYETPETLGSDRLAMVAAAMHMYPNQNCLVIGAGTCITYDFIDANGHYLGGAISPGIMMRLKALHTFTSKLPLVSIEKKATLTGTTTAGSIRSGVLNGSISEIDGIINRYRANYKEMQVIITGGDMNYFHKRLKSSIFAASNLVLTGLNVILKFNVDKQ